MLHLDIQKGGEAKKTFIFQKDLGGTAACMKIPMTATKGVANWHQMKPTLLIDCSVE